MSKYAQHEMSFVMPFPCQYCKWKITLGWDSLGTGLPFLKYPPWIKKKKKPINYTFWKSIAHMSCSLKIYCLHLDSSSDSMDFCNLPHPLISKLSFTQRSHLDNACPDWKLLAVLEIQPLQVVQIVQRREKWPTKSWPRLLSITAAHHVVFVHT